MMEIKKILIVGPGQMGSGIAHVMAQTGVEVRLRSYSLDSVKRGMAYIEKNIDKMVSKGKMTEEQKEEIFSRIDIGPDWGEAECKDVDMAIEAVPEKMDMKIDYFQKFDKWCPPHAILATNTSSLSVTALGRITSRPDKVIGVHFFSPVHLMRLVEIVNSMATSEETNAAVTKLVADAGKSPVKVNDYPGFVGNRIMVPMMNEAIQTYFEGVADPKTIDDCAVLGFNHPIGPLRLCDAIGNDTILAVMEVLHRELGDDKYRPSPLLRKMVEAGYLGKKAGRGFYNDYQK